MHHHKAPVRVKGVQEETIDDDDPSTVCLSGSDFLLARSYPDGREHESRSQSSCPEMRPRKSEVIGRITV